MEIKYRSNKDFDIEIFYTRNPELKEISGGFYPFLKHIFYAYPTGIKIHATASKSLWRVSTFKLQIDNKIEKIDIAQRFLEKLNEAWRYDKSKVMFMWDGRKISNKSLEEITKEFDGKYKPSIAYMGYKKLRFSEEGSIILQQTINVITETGKVVPDVICISVRG